MCAARAAHIAVGRQFYGSVPKLQSNYIQKLCKNSIYLCVKIPEKERFEKHLDAISASSLEPEPGHDRNMHKKNAHFRGHFKGFNAGAARLLRALGHGNSDEGQKKYQYRTSEGQNKRNNGHNRFYGVMGLGVGVWRRCGH